MRKMSGDEECICISCGVVDTWLYAFTKGFPSWVIGRELPATARVTGDMGSIPGSGRFPGELNGN